MDIKQQLIAAIEDIEYPHYKTPEGIQCVRSLHLKVLINELIPSNTVMVPIKDIETIQELWNAGFDPDDDLCKLFALLTAHKGENDER